MIMDPQPQAESIGLHTHLFHPDHISVLEPLIERANSVLWRWKSFPVVLPKPELTEQSAESEAKAPLHMRDLFIEPDLDEVTRLAVNASGEQRKLSAEQLQSVRLTGEFQLDSSEFPGQQHRWILSQLLVKGSVKAAHTFYDNVALAAYLTVIVAKDRLVGHCFSLRDAASGWCTGLTNFVDLLIGLPRMDAVNLNQKLRCERARFLVAELKCQNKKQLADLCQYISLHTSHPEVSGVAAAQPDRRLPVPIPYEFVTPQSVPIDLMLCCHQVMSGAKPYLLHCLNQAAKGWIGERRKQLMSTRPHALQSEEQWRRSVEKAIADEYLERVCHLIQTDSGIKRIQPPDPSGEDRIAGLLVQQVRSFMLIRDALDEQEDRLQQHMGAVEASLQKRHLILWRVRPWLRRRLRRARDAFIQQHRLEPHDKCIDRCKSLGLTQAAYFLSRDLIFRRDREPVLRKELEQIQEPVKTFHFATRIWQPRHWIVKERLAGDAHFRVIPTRFVCDLDASGGQNLSSTLDEAGERQPRFMVEKYRYSSSSTSYPFWRWVNFVMRTTALFWNCVFLFGLLIPWCSPVSLRALVCVRPFFPDYEVHPSNGSLRRSRLSKTHTLPSRIRALWLHVREERKKFDSSPDTGLLPKSMMRYLHCFLSYFVKGVCGTVLLCMLLPASILLINCVSLTLAATAVIHVPMLSLAAHLLAWVFFDPEGVSTCNSLLLNLVVHVLLRGIVQPICALIMAILLCPAGSLVLLVVAAIRLGLRTAWDAVVFELVLRRRARIPIKDGVFVRRTAGPGLSSNYFYQVKPEQALAVLESKLQLEQLAAYQGHMTRLICQPKEQYRHFMSQVLGPFGVSLDGGNKHSSGAGPATDDPYCRLESECEALLRKLQETVEARCDQLKPVLPTATLARIRMSEADLKVVLHQGARIVQAFFTTNIFSLLNQEELQSFWDCRQLEANDWLALTAGLLSDSFSPGFLLPLQAVDLTYQLRVQHWDLHRFVSMALDSQWSDDLDDVVRVIQTPHMRSLYVAQPEIPLEAFNPLGYGPAQCEEEVGVAHSLLTKLEPKKWLPMHRPKQNPSKPPFALTNPLPLLHPLEIVLIIQSRDSVPGQGSLDLDHPSTRAVLSRLIDYPRSLTSEFLLSSPSSACSSLCSLSNAHRPRAASATSTHIALLEHHGGATNTDHTRSLEHVDRQLELTPAPASMAQSEPLLSSPETKPASSSHTSLYHAQPVVVNPDSFSTIV